MLAKETIRGVLLDVNPSARRLFANVLEVSTGINPATAVNLDFEQSLHFFKQVWGNCLYWGNQRIDFVEQSVKEVTHFLENNFQSESDMHDLNFFSQKLNLYKGTKNIIATETEQVSKTTELLQKFHSVRFKTAALIMRFLCLDSNFFLVDKKKLIPPLDRVNYRMCQQIFGSSYTEKRVGKKKASFSKDQIMAFDQLGRDILDDDKVLIDNFWFIGHFYHDGLNCKIRVGSKIVDFPYLQNVDLSEDCPFSKYGCCKNIN